LPWDEIAAIVAASFLNETDEADQYVEWLAHAWVPTGENVAVAYADLTSGDYTGILHVADRHDPGHGRGGHGGTLRP